MQQARKKGHGRTPANNFFFSSRRRHTRLVSDWSSDVCSSDLKSPAEAADSHSAVPSHREVAVRTAPGFCWLIRAHEPKAKSNIYRYSPPIADSALSAPGSIRSTDRVGPSSKPEKTTTDRPVPALHSAGSAPGS